MHPRSRVLPGVPLDNPLAPQGPCKMPLSELKSEIGIYWLEVAIFVIKSMLRNSRFWLKLQAIKMETVFIISTHGWPNWPYLSLGSFFFCLVSNLSYDPQPLDGSSNTCRQTIQLHVGIYSLSSANDYHCRQLKLFMNELYGAPEGI